MSIELQRLAGRVEKQGLNYLFDDCGDICVLLGGGAGFGAGFFDMSEDFVVGENGGLGFEDLGNMMLG